MPLSPFASIIYNTVVLYGVDFTDAQIQGVNFARAILTGANFKGARILPTSSGSRSDFSSAFLQGTILTDTNITDEPSLKDAFVDFTDGGNNLYILLKASDHNRFACSNCRPPTGSDVCAFVRNTLPTSVPDAVKMVCPSGLPARICGLPVGSNKNWQSSIAVLPNASYDGDSTYIKKLPDPLSVCGNMSPIRRW